MTSSTKPEVHNVG